MNKVVYVSRGGNTKKLADAVAAGAKTTAVSVEEAGALENVDILFVGASIYMGKIDAKMRTFLQGLTAEQVKKVVVFGSSARGQKALPEIKTILEPKGISVSDDTFNCDGAFLVFHKGDPDEEDLEEAKEFAEEICKD